MFFLFRFGFWAIFGEGEVEAIDSAIEGRGCGGRGFALGLRCGFALLGGWMDGWMDGWREGCLFCLLLECLRERGGGDTA